jgi:hypothetical protein
MAFKKHDRVDCVDVQYVKRAQRTLTNQIVKPYRGSQQHALELRFARVYELVLK